MSYDREEALRELTGAQETDPESGHGDADEVLCKLLTALGYSDVVAEWKKVHKWYA